MNVVSFAKSSYSSLASGLEEKNRTNAAACHNSPEMPLFPGRAVRFHSLKRIRTSTNCFAPSELA